MMPDMTADTVTCDSLNAAPGDRSMWVMGTCSHTNWPAFCSSWMPDTVYMSRENLNRWAQSHTTSSERPTWSGTVRMGMKQAGRVMRTRMRRPQV